MKTALKVIAVLTIAMVASAAFAKWDSSFVYRTTITAAAASASVTVPIGSYVKVQCDIAARIGSGITSRTCATSGANSCVYYAAREPFYAQLHPNEDTIAAYPNDGTSTATCQVYLARN